MAALLAEDQGGEMGDLGDEEDPGEVMLIWAQLEARLSSLGVLSTVILGIRPSIERERTPIPTGEGERDRRRPEKLVPLCKTSMSHVKLFHQNRLLWTLLWIYALINYGDLSDYVNLRKMYSVSMLVLYRLSWDDMNYYFHSTIYAGSMFAPKIEDRPK